MAAIDTVKKKVISVKNKVVENKTKILAGVAIVSTTVALLQAKGIKDLTDFLEEKDLLDEYRQPEE